METKTELKQKSYYTDDISVCYENGMYQAEMVDGEENPDWRMHCDTINYIETLPKLFNIYCTDDLENEFCDGFYSYKQAVKKVEYFTNKYPNDEFIIKEANCYDLYDFIHYQDVIDVKKYIII